MRVPGRRLTLPSPLDLWAFVQGLTLDGVFVVGLSVIAVGIQTEVETALLIECGCQYGQGELRARPGQAPSPEPNADPAIVDLRDSRRT